MSSGKKSPATKLVVDGETFSVRRRSGRPPTYDFDWLSGPNPGYGFSTGLHGATHLTEPQLREEISDFLAGIDPETGYLADN